MRCSLREGGTFVDVLRKWELLGVVLHDQVEEKLEVLRTYRGASEFDVLEAARKHLKDIGVETS